MHEGIEARDVLHADRLPQPETAVPREGNDLMATAGERRARCDPTYPPVPVTPTLMSPSLGRRSDRRWP